MPASTRPTRDSTCPISTTALRRASGSWRRPARCFRVPGQRRNKRIGAWLMVIDCHCHAGKGDLMTAPWNTEAPIELYLRRARAAGIDKTVVLPVFNTDYSEANA